MFQGHQFVSLINKNWIFDLTEFIGYKVKLDENDNVISYKEAFQAIVIDSDIVFEKSMRVPLKVLKEAYSQISNYYKEFEVSYESE